MTPGPRSGRSFRLRFLGAILVAGLAPLPLLAQRSGSVEAWRTDPELHRVRALDGRVADLAAQPARSTLAIPLFDGQRVRAHLERFRRTASGGHTWYGGLESAPEDYLAYAVKGGALVGVLRHMGSVYRLRETRDGGIALYETDPTRSRACDNDERSIVPAATDRTGIRSLEEPVDTSDGGTLALRAQTGPAPGGGLPPLVTYTPPARKPTRVDVLVAWTMQAQNAVGSAEAMQALVDLSIVEANVAFRNSEVDIELNGVLSSLINYEESGSMATDLARLRGTDDGYMDTIHTWRDNSGADIVSLVVANTTRCGRSYNMGSPPSAGFASSAFNLVSYSCATGYYAFAHEVGHNAGLDHDRPNTMNTPSWPWAYGYWLDGTYRTIMALELGELFGTRIQYFSNPDLTYMGLPLGVATTEPNPSHCAKALNDNRDIVAAWRTPPAPLTASTPDSVVPPGRLEARREGGATRVTLRDPRGTIGTGAIPFLLVTRRPIPTLDGRPFLRDLGTSLVAWRRLPAWEGSETVASELVTGAGLYAQVVVFDPQAREVVLGDAKAVAGR